MKVCTAIPVRYAETDKMAVVYHANYLLYFEDARTRFLEELGYPYARIEQAGLHVAGRLVRSALRRAFAIR